MLRTYIPVKGETRELLYDVKRGDTWDSLLVKMLRAYKAKQRADRCRAVPRQRGAGKRQRGGSRGTNPKA